MPKREGIRAIKVVSTEYLTLPEMREKILCMVNKVSEYSHSTFRDHISMVDYQDGSSYDLWTVSPSEVIIVPMGRMTFESLLRLLKRIDQVYTSQKEEEEKTDTEKDYLSISYQEYKKLNAHERCERLEKYIHENKEVIDSIRKNMKCKFSILIKGNEVIGQFNSIDRAYYFVADYKKKTGNNAIIISPMG